MKFDIRTIIVPFDFSARCRAAALHAVGLARRYDASMLFVHVIPYSSFEYTAFEGGSYVGQAWPSEADIETRLRSEVAQLEIGDDVKERIHIRALKGDPPRKIEETADSAEAPLIVLPTHGYGPFRRFVLGSVTTKILHDLECPVLTGSHLEEQAPPTEAAYRSVACAIDLGEHSADVLTWAGAFARSWDAKLTVVHAVHWLETAAIDAQAFTPTSESKIVEAARRQAEDLVRETGVEAEVRVGFDAITRYLGKAVEECDADIVVIGRSLGRDPASRLMAHAYELIRASPRPVLSV